MTQVTLQEIHNDLESLKRDMAQLKSALLGDEGELSDWAKTRIEQYVSKGSRKVVSQKEVESDFL